MFKKHFSSIKGIFFLIPLITIVLLFTFLPLINTFFDSFKIYARNSRVKFSMGFDNFSNLIYHDEQFAAAFHNTNLVFIFGFSLSMIFSFLFALLVNSLSSKFSKNVLITSLYSQFFISIFAIGTSFIFLFGQEKNVFNKIFNTDIQFNKENILLLYTIYFIWRIFPFNSVIFIFALTKANEKYNKKIYIDKLSLKDKINNIYWFEIKKTLSLVIYINFISVILIYPQSILGESVNLNLNKSHTFLSYILEFVKPVSGIINESKAASISILLFLWIIFIFIFVYLLKYIYEKIIILLNNKKGSKNAF